VPTAARVLLLYTVLTLLTIGRFAIAHPASVCSCVGTQDPAAYMWALTWWPHAILHGINPFVTHYLWSPTGVNVAQGAMIPTAAIAMAPITALAGPIVSYNVLSVASPVLAAMTSYLLCRRLTRREFPAVAGGYLFGFSMYEFAQLQGHLNLTLVFLIPVMVHIALRRVDREISRRSYVVAMAALFVLQAGLSTELLADCVGLGAVLLLVSRFLTRATVRRRVDGLIVETLGAGLLAIVVASPFLYYALFNGGVPKGAPALSDVYGLDLLNLFFPTYATWLGHTDFLALSLRYNGGNVAEADGYLGIPLVVCFLVWVFRAGGGGLLRKLVVVAAAVSVLAALGSHLHVAGQQTVALPFDWVRSLPVFNNIVPSRIVVFTALAVSVGVAAWLAIPGRGALVRWLAVALGALVILPNLMRPLYGVPPHSPSFFSTSTYRRYLARGDTVLALPYGADDVSMLWQAETDFYFYMPEGYVSGAVPSPFNAQLTTGQLLADTLPSPQAMAAFIREHFVTHVVIDVAHAGQWPDLMSRLGLHGRSIGGVLLYAVPGA
jgi:hypothetical protein